MFDRPFQVGDRVAYGGEYGDIIKIGLRSVRMNTLDHNIITIPNNKVFTDVTSSSGNYGALEMQVAMDFYIGVDQDAKLAAELIREACLTSPYVFLARPVPVLAKQVDPPGLRGVAAQGRARTSSTASTRSRSRPTCTCVCSTRFASAASLRPRSCTARSNAARLGCCQRS